VAYCTLAEIKAQIDERDLIMLTDDAAAGAVDEEIVAAAIADADEEIDGYVGSRHRVPLSPVPGIIRKQSVDIALYNLHARRKRDIPELRQKRYDNAIRFLEQVAKGTISLGVHDPEGNPPRADRPELSIDNPERIFDREKMKGF
jgi:phage gp36-like protein